jgi:site-specific DNA-methyltransferase (cytosine-N4-specific)
MTGPFFAEHDVTLWQGDVLDVLPTLPAESVNCVVTSPPYYGLRDYGTGTWEGGGADCAHAKPLGDSPLNANFNERWGNSSGQRKQETAKTQQFRDVCGLCGARRVDQQIGLEASPAEYVETMRAVFAEVRRVLRPDGVLWLNLGDSYYSGRGNPGEGDVDTKQPARRGWIRTLDKPGQDWAKPKDLLGIPWRVAFALQDDGWTLRNDVIWAKPNAMPESVTDRLSTRHEHVFLFSKSRRYWFDLDPIREAAATADRAGPRRSYAPGSASSMREGEHQPMRGPFAGLPLNEAGRNPGDVWTIATQPYPGAHFATFPPELARRCIAAGCPPDGAVLDPFTGSGTTLMVARRLLRKSVGIELNSAYCELIVDRIGQPIFDFGEATA